MISLRLLQQISGDRAVEGNLSCAPIINHDLGIFPCKWSYVCGKTNNGHCFLVIVGDCSILFLQSIILYLFCVFFQRRVYTLVWIFYWTCWLLCQRIVIFTVYLVSCWIVQYISLIKWNGAFSSNQRWIFIGFCFWFVFDCLSGWFQIHWQ